MPRIDPLQLLKCLSVLLAPDGGIKSKEEVQRIASLMTKFSKKLVSKCIYVQILKTTKSDLLSMFMAAGGWGLAQMWLKDAITAKNWPLIQELLDLLFFCPVDIERLKINNCPKLIKGLSKDSDNESVRVLAGKIVEQWMRVVKEEDVDDDKEFSRKEDLKLSDRLHDREFSRKEDLKLSDRINNQDVSKNDALKLSDNVINKNSIKEEIKVEAEEQEDEEKPKKRGKRGKKKKADAKEIKKTVVGGRILRPRKKAVPKVKKQEESQETKSDTSEDQNTSEESNQTWDAPAGQLPVYKITIRDGKQVLAKVYPSERTVCKTENTDSEEGAGTKEVINDVQSAKSEIGYNVCKQPSTEISKSDPRSHKVSNNVDISLEVKKEEESADDVSPNKAPTKMKNLKTSVKLQKQDSSSSVESRKDTVKSVKEKKKLKDEGSDKGVKDSEKKSKNLENNKEKVKNEEKDKSKEKGKEKSKDTLKDKLKEKEIEKENAKRIARESKIQLQYERDKETYAKLMMTPSNISRMGKIPKKIRPPEEDPGKKTEERVSSEIKKQPAAELKKPYTAEPKKPYASNLKKPIPVAEVKKPVPTFEIRKPSLSNNAPRPKTVKTFNSKFRSTGLEEEVKPPPPRVQKKALPPTVDRKIVLDKAKLPTLKRPSPPREIFPPEKRTKPTILELDKNIEDTKKVEKPGGIKLIAAKPKPTAFLQESDVFMDALTAGSRIEPRKRKRRTSSSKDGPDSKKDSIKDDDNKSSSPPSSPCSEDKPPTESPTAVKPALRFYQDTLETDDVEKEENKEKEEKEPEKATEKKESNEDDRRTPTPTPEEEIEEVSEIISDKISLEEKNPSEESSQSEESNKELKLLKGVLVYHKAFTKSNKSVKWKEDSALEDILYFELDETERVNVTKTFLDMKQMERTHERESFQMARKLAHDIMEEKTSWQVLITVEVPTVLVEPGKGSREKDVQYAREKVVLQALYFSRELIPDSSAEPDPEMHPTTDPIPIPLDDVTGNPDSINDFHNTPWPDPKPAAIPQLSPVHVPANIPNFIPNDVGPPVSSARAIIGGDWRTGDGKVLAEMPVPMDTFQGPPSLLGVAPPMVEPFPMPANNFEEPFIDFNMGYVEGGEEMMNFINQPPPNFSLAGGAPAPPIFPFQGVPRGRGNMNMGPGPRGRGHMGGPRGPGGPWFRPNRPPRGQGGWRGRGGPTRGRMCNYFMNGYCRNGDNCDFLHPGVNGPQIPY